MIRLSNINTKIDIAYRMKMSLKMHLLINYLCSLIKTQWERETITSTIRYKVISFVYFLKNCCSFKLLNIDNYI